MKRMNFDLAELQAFVAVAERQSFRAAAEALHLSQPALSRRIDKLEAALGTARLALGSLQDAVLRLAGDKALPRLGVPARHATLAAVRLVEPVVERVLGLVTPVDRPLPPAAAALHDLLATALPGRWLTPIAPSAAPARTPAR